MAAYVLADVKPNDPEAYRTSGYLEAAKRTAAKHGGVYRVRGGQTTVLEGDWEPRRFVLIEFPTMEDLRAWHADPEYQPWIEVRQRLADSRLVAVEGVPED